MGGVTTALKDQCSPAMKFKQSVTPFTLQSPKGPGSGLQRESESLSAQIWAQISFRFSSEALILQAQELYITLRSQDTLPPPGVFTLLQFSQGENNRQGVDVWANLCKNITIPGRGIQACAQLSCELGHIR